MANKDLFAAPSKKELEVAQGSMRTSPGLDLFAPPSKEELAGPETIMDRVRGGRELLAKKFEEATSSPEYQAEQAKIAAENQAKARGYVRTGLNQLPVIGSIGGGIAGAAGGLLAVPVTGPAGPIAGEYAGAGAGGALGEGLRYAGEKYLLGDDMNGQDLTNRMLTGGAAGVIGQGFGNIVSAGAKSFANSGVQDISQNLARPGAEQIKAAATGLGVKPTQGMLTDDYVVRNLEDSLGQSPSIPGAIIRGEQKPVREAISGAVNKAVSGQSMQSDVEAGKALRKGVENYFEGRTEPIRKSYSDIEAQTKGIPLNEKGLGRIAKNIRNLPEAKFESFEGHGIANKFADALESAKDANDLKILMTKAKNILNDQNASYEAKSVAAKIADKLDQARKNTVTRQAVSIARDEAYKSGKIETPKMAPEASEAFPFLKPAREAMDEESASIARGGEQLKAAENEGLNKGRALIGKIKETDKQYQGLLDDARAFGKGSGLTKANKGMAATLNDIAKATPEEMSTALFDQNNIEFTRFVKDKMPEQFEIAKNQKIAQLVKQAGGDTNKILKITEKMSPEAKEMLFGAENVDGLSNANTLLKSIPGKVGASDTPRGIDFHDLGLLQNARDLGRYGLLKGKRLVPNLGRGLLKSRPLLQGLVNSGLIYDDGNPDEQLKYPALRGPAAR